MNKLIIIGNGFDLAHGLPTSYKHFIDDFWSKFKSNYKSKEYLELVYVNELYYSFFDFGSINTFNDLSSNLTSYCSEYSDDREFFVDKMVGTATKLNGQKIDFFRFKNEFFKEINVKNSIENWVDIENEYYQKLKRVLKQIPNSKMGRKSNSLEDQILENKKQVVKLNQEFEQIKKLFENYLKLNVLQGFDLNKLKAIPNEIVKMKDFLKPISRTNTDETRLLLEFPLKEDKKSIESIFPSLAVVGEETESYILNFNYTSSISKYMYDIFDFGFDEKINYIHGNLWEESNRINFGFGDEMDEDYKFIENLNENEYLKNFKSFKYSQNSNYQDLLRFIESGKFQVYVMGHSCGLSDRTLLNTIFEHEKCRSIKVFYHKKEDGSDNFVEIIQNISRHFNNKRIMREKIVNKSLCQPLPQNIRFQEKNTSN